MACWKISTRLNGVSYQKAVFSIPSIYLSPSCICVPLQFFDLSAQLPSCPSISVRLIFQYFLILLYLQTFSLSPHPSLFICPSQCLTPSLDRLPETTYACKLAMPYIIYPIVIKFYTNCDIFIASMRPQSNTYQCARLHLVNVRVPESPIRIAKKKYSFDETDFGV